MNWFKKKKPEPCDCPADQAFLEMESSVTEYMRRERKKIVFSEDDFIMSEVVQSFFRSATDRDIKVSSTTEKLEEDIVSKDTLLIFSDVKITGGNTVDLIYKYWKMGKVKCPIHFYSGEALVQPLLDMITEMGASFFKKPYNLSELEDKIINVLAENK